jgi:uncharacterized protein YdhG (YjbR/CyaY superfamily)
VRRSRSSAVGQRDTRMPKSHYLPLRLIDQHNGAVSAQEVDQYLDALEEPKRAALARLRQTILEILPEADQGISYGVPAFKVRGKAIAGFAAFKNHLSYLPHSGSVFPQLHDELAGYTTSSGALRFGIDEPLPVPLVEKLITVRLQQAFPARPAALSRRCASRRQRLPLMRQITMSALRDTQWPQRRTAARNGGYTNWSQCKLRHGRDRGRTRLARVRVRGHRG